MNAPIDLSNIPQDTCPLCRQRALTLSAGILRCSNCNSVAELDAQTNRIRYSSVSVNDERFSDIEDTLKQNWLSRQQLFALTTRPLPAVVFLPIILSLLALCVLLGVIGSVLAIRPSLMTSRNLIEAAYSKSLTSDITQTITVTSAILMSSTGDITATAEISGDIQKLTGTLVVQIETPTLLATTAPEPPVDASTVTRPPPVTQPVNRPTETALPATNTPIPTSATRAIVLTATTLGASSPIRTPTVVSGATVTATANPTSTLQPTSTVLATVSITPSSTITTGTPSASPTPTETVVFSGTAPSGQPGRSVILANFIQISDIKVKGDPSFNEGDEYIDLRNLNQTQTVSMARWKLRVNGVATYFLPGNAAASESFAIPPDQGCRIYTGNVQTQVPAPVPYGWCGPRSFTVNNPEGLYTNERGIIEILDDTGKVVASFMY